MENSYNDIKISIANNRNFNISLKVSTWMKKYTVLGPPGTGKTRFIEKIIKERKPDDFLYLTYNVNMAQFARERIEDDRHKIGTIHSIMAQKNGLGPFLKFEDHLRFAKEHGMTVPVKGRSDPTGQTDLERFLRFYDRTVNLMEKPYQPMDEPMSTAYLYDKYEKWKEKEGKYDYTDILKEGAEHSYYTGSLFVDESQDLSRLMWKIIDNIQCEERYIVGDPHQSINGFRGVMVDDFISRISDPTVLGISYRFGDNVRELGDMILGTSRLEQEKYRGIGKSEIDRHSIGSFANLEGSKAILCRTNALAAYLANRLPYANIPISSEHSWGNGWNKQTFRVAGIMMKWPKIDADEFQYVVEHSPADLWVRGTKAKVRKSATLFSYDMMKTPMNTREIVRKLKIDVKVKENVLGLLKGDIPIVQIDTIHSAKGLEWDHVMVMLDFPQKIDIDDEERRLYYVAATRARQSLDFWYAGYYKNDFPIPGHAKVLNATLL